MAAKETLERELKLAAPDGFELPDLGGEPLERRTFTSTYYDTPDHRLARAGITLRRRVEHGKGLWQLKLPEGTARRELEQRRRPRRDRLRNSRGCWWHSRTRGSYRRSPSSAPDVRGSGLPTTGTGRRTSCSTRSPSWTPASVISRFTELEVELVEGDEQALEAISGALKKGRRQRGRAPSEGLPRARTPR